LQRTAGNNRYIEQKVSAKEAREGTATCTDRDVIQKKEGSGQKGREVPLRGSTSNFLVYNRHGAHLLSSPFLCLYNSSYYIYALLVDSITTI
jgi:hypothetical protein